jgi:EAL domain-containing protein (putative c-di-GMP-specific phosphodiesterase class I)/ActR/RegA family two-component response regulator
MSEPLMPQPRILLVDDDPFMLGLQSFMLRGLGFDDVATAGNARAALSSLQSGERTADVIICDLNMPGMDGVEFLQALNAGIFTGSVILLSGEGARIMHTVQKLLSGGRLSVLGALEKPAQPEALHALLRCWVPPRQEEEHVTLPMPVIDVADMPEAVLANQWVLHYQPKVMLSSGAVTGVEALVRWNHPRHGLVFPDSFIDLAEEGGMIDALTDWVLVAAIKQLACWNAQRLSLSMAVNVSMDNLRARSFARRVGALVREAGVSAQNVTLEITESRAMSPSPMPLESLVRLRLQRFRLSIDDFGTGHSSLAQLRDVPFTELKVDRGFVHGAHGNQIIRPMLEGSIGIAKRLGMLSVAEGVEDEQDWHFLRRSGCDLAQGYFIGRPMEAAQMQAWMADWAARRERLLED